MSPEVTPPEAPAPIPTPQSAETMPPVSGSEVDPATVVAAQNIVAEAPVTPPAPEAPAPIEPAASAPAPPMIDVPVFDPSAQPNLGPRFEAPAPKPAAPLQDPNLPEQKQPIKITTIEGN